MAVSKKRVIKSLENLSDDLKDLLKDQYPNGYEGSITRITNAKKEPIFVFPLETDDATYLIKVPATKNSEGEYDVESKPDAEDFDNSSGDDYGEEDSAAVAVPPAVMTTTITTMTAVAAKAVVSKATIPISTLKPAGTSPASLPLPVRVTPGKQKHHLNPLRMVFFLLSFSAIYRRIHQPAIPPKRLSPRLG